MAVAERRSWGVLASLFLLSVGFTAYVIAPASVFPLVMAEFGIDKPSASASISAVFLTWAVLQIPGGYVLDRHDNRRLVVLGSVIFLLGATGGLFVGGYRAFLVSRLLSGATVVFGFVGSVNVLRRVLPDHRRALGISVYVASPPVGLALAQFSAPRIAAPYGWRAAVLAYLLVALAGLVGFMAALRRPITPEERASASAFLAALRNPSVLLVSLSSLCTYAVWTYLNTWMPTYGNEVLGIDLAAAGATAALVPLAGVLARPAGGWLADLLDGGHRPVIVASFLASAVLLVLLNAATSPPAFAALLALTGAAVNLAVGLYLVYVGALADEATQATQATSLSVLATFSQVGNLVAPVVGGWVIAEVSWTAGFGFGVALAVLGLGAVLLAPVSA